MTGARTSGRWDAPADTACDAGRSTRKGSLEDTPEDTLARESGQIMLLTSAFVAFALLLVTVVVSATQVHLERKRLFDLADALALAAADSMSQETFYAGAAERPTDSAVLTLTDGEIQAEVRHYLQEHPDATAGLHGVQVVGATTTDGRTAEVSLTALARPAMVSWVTQLWSDGIIVRAEARARAW